MQVMEDEKMSTSPSNLEVNVVMLPLRHKGEEKAEVPENPNVDSGWAFVVLVAMYGTFFLNSGLLSTAGIYFVSLLHGFERSRFMTTTVMSLLVAFCLFGGPLGTVFMHRFGVRNTIRLGSIMMTLGYYLSAFAPSLWILFITYDVLVGFGMSFVYTGQIMALNLYFDRYQFLATSVAMTAIGFGVYLVNMWAEYYIRDIGWRGSFIMNAGLCLQLYVLGSLVYPLQQPGDTSGYSQQPAHSTHKDSIYLSHRVASLFSRDCKRRLTIMNIAPEATYVSQFFNEANTSQGSSYRILRSDYFWLISLSYFCATLSSTSVNVIYKDLMNGKGFPEHYTKIMLGYGAGDVLGRLCMGILHSFKYSNCILSYCGALALGGVVILCHMFVNTVDIMYIFSTLFGMTYGAQNVLIAIVPVRLYGRDKLEFVFGKLIFLGGFGALLGGPIAGSIVDHTLSYDGVLIFSMGSFIIGAVLMLVCFIIESVRNKLSKATVSEFTS